MKNNLSRLWFALPIAALCVALPGCKAAMKKNAAPVAQLEPAAETLSLSSAAPATQRTLAAQPALVPQATLAAQPVAMAQPVLSVQPVAMAQPTSGAVSSITQAAVKEGVLSCTSRINQVATFLANGGQSGAFLFVPPAQQDQRIFSASLEVANTNGMPAYASASFAPNQANGCGALYETVTYWPGRCEDMAAKQYSGATSLGKMGQTSILGIGSSARVFLMPVSEKGCVSIKKEVLL